MPAVVGFDEEEKEDPDEVSTRAGCFSSLTISNECFHRQTIYHLKAWPSPIMMIIPHVHQVAWVTCVLPLFSA